MADILSRRRKERLATLYARFVLELLEYGDTVDDVNPALPVVRNMP